MIGTIIGNLDGITLELDVGTELGSLDKSYYCSNNGKLEGLFIGDSLGSTDGDVLGSDKGISLLSTDGKVIGTIIVNVDGITPGLDVGTDLDSLDESYYCSNNGKLKGLFLGGSI